MAGGGPILVMEGRGRLFIVDLSLFMAESRWGLYEKRFDKYRRLF